MQKKFTSSRGGSSGATSRLTRRLIKGAVLAARSLRKSVEFAIGAYTVTTENEQKKYSYLQHGTPLEGDKYAFIKYNDFVKTNN